jgi:hypothetical protein
MKIFIRTIIYTLNGENINFYTFDTFINEIDNNE